MATKKRKTWREVDVTLAPQYPSRRKTNDESTKLISQNGKREATWYPGDDVWVLHEYKKGDPLWGHAWYHVRDVKTRRAAENFVSGKTKT